MEQFFMISFVAILPYSWALWRGLKRKGIMDVVIASLILYICLFHLGIFYATISLSAKLSLFWSVMHGLVICQLIPLILIYICRKGGVSYDKSVVYLCSLTVLVFLSRASIEIGWGGGFPLESPDPFTVTVYYEGKKIWYMFNYEAVMILQALFFVYKLSGLLGLMRRRNYHFSPRFRHFLYFLLFTSIVVILSIVPSDEFWFEGNNALYFVTYCLVTLGILSLMIGLGFYDVMFVDQNDMPVSFEKSRQFADMAERFVGMLNSGKISLTGNVLMDDVASLLGTNRTYLAMMMKEEFGTTFSNYMNSRRIAKAKRLIVESNYQAKMHDVAWQSGFSSLSSFNKVFKATTGVTPSEWRSDVL